MGKNVLNKIKILRPKIIKLSDGNVMRFLQKKEVGKNNQVFWVCRISIGYSCAGHLFMSTEIYWQTKPNSLLQKDAGSTIVCFFHGK